MKSYNYQSGFKFTEVVLKGITKSFVEGYISTIDEDEQGEIVTSEAQDSIMAQIKGKVITMDLEHEEWVEDGNVLSSPKQNLIPIAKIVHAERRTKGVWVKAELNKDAPRYKNIWGSIKSGFLHSFSIGFYTTKSIAKEIGGTIKNFIQDLNLVNVALTGCPINPNATFAPVMKAALKSMEENKMTEENKEEIKTEEPIVEEKKEELKEESKTEATENTEVSELKKQVEDKTAEISKLVIQLEESNAKKEEIIEPASEINPMGQIKSLKGSMKDLDAEISKLKAQINLPVMKSIVEKKIVPQEKEKSPMDFI